MQRAQSVPVLASSSHRAPRDREARNRTVKSNGCGADSPSSWQQLHEIRSKLMNTQIFFEPTVEITIWKGHLYAGVWWHPHNAPLAILRPENWHTTLLRCWHPDGAAEVYEPYLVAWNELLTDMLRMLVRPKADVWGLVPVWLRIPPWRKSYTFGVPTEVLPICEILQKMLATLCHSVGYDAADVREDEFHISWN